MKPPSEKTRYEMLYHGLYQRAEWFEIFTLSAEYAERILLLARWGKIYIFLFILVYRTLNYRNTEDSYKTPQKMSLCARVIIVMMKSFQCVYQFFLDIFR